MDSVKVFEKVHREMVIFKLNINRQVIVITWGGKIYKLRSYCPFPFHFIYLVVSSGIYFPLRLFT